MDKQDEYDTDPETAEQTVADPTLEETFLHSNLSWTTQKREGRFLLAFYRHLIAFRKTHPGMKKRTRNSLEARILRQDVICMERKGSGETLVILLHFGDNPINVQHEEAITLEKILDSASGSWGGPAPDSFPTVFEGDRITLYPYSAVVFKKKT